VAAGLGLILHGLAHAVFALRGSAAWRPTPGESHAFLILLHGISIDAPDWVVWAWLVQIGASPCAFAL